MRSGSYTLWLGYLVLLSAMTGSSSSSAGTRLSATLAGAVSATQSGSRVPLPREKVVYSRLAPANFDLYLFDGARHVSRRLAPHPALDYNATFSPDGRWVVFCSERRGGPDLFAIDLQSEADPILLTDSNALEDAPAFSPDGRMLAFVSDRHGDADIFVMPFRPHDPRSADAVNVTRNPAGDFNPAFSPDGAKIAFSSDRDTDVFGQAGQFAGPAGITLGASNIYVMNVEGSNPVRLTTSPGWDGSPAWSSDGRLLYFYSERDAGFRVWRMRADGTDPRPLSPQGAMTLSPAAAPAGRVAFAAAIGSGSKIFSVATDGADQRPESSGEQDCRAPAFDGKGRMVCHGTPPVQASGSQSGGRPFRVGGIAPKIQLPDRELEVEALLAAFPSLGPDSTEVVTTRVGLAMSRPDGSELRTVFKQNAPSDIWATTWSRDGKWIAFTVGPQFAPPEIPVDIWKVRPDGTGAVNLTGGAKANNAFPDLSEDGRRIVFRSGRDGNHEIYIMDADGRNERRLTYHPETDTMPAISPRGDWIAFSSNRDGDFEIYIMQLDPGKERGAPTLYRITRSPGPDTHPRFSPDGRWLIFASGRGGFNDEAPLSFPFGPQSYGEIWATWIEGGPTVRLTHNKWEDSLPSWGSFKKE